MVIRTSNLARCPATRALRLLASVASLRITVREGVVASTFTLHISLSAKIESLERELKFSNHFWGFKVLPNSSINKVTSTKETTRKICAHHKACESLGRCTSFPWVIKGTNDFATLALLKATRHSLVDLSKACDRNGLWATLSCVIAV